MRVLMHGVPFDSDYSCLDAYAGEHEIRSLGTRDVMPFPAYVYAHHYHFAHAHDRFEDIIRGMSDDWVPDLFLCWYPEIFAPPLGIEHSPIPTVALVSDWGYRYPALELNLSRFDVVLTDRPGVKVLTNEYVNAQCLFPLYSHRSVTHRQHDVPRDIDVLYLGALQPAMRPVRSRYLERIAKLSGQYNVMFGTGFEGDDYARQLSRAKIVFNYCVRGELNLRVWETLACGALLFVEDSNPEVRDYFADGRDIVLYNEDNLEELLAHYLGHPVEARAIAERGHSRSVEFAGENKFDPLIAWCAEQQSSRAFDRLSHDERRLADIRLLSHSFLSSVQEVEVGLCDQLCAECGGDARAWTAKGYAHMSPYLAGETLESGRTLALQAFVCAQELDSDSGPYAMNAASACRATGDDELERGFLDAALSAGSLGGAGDLSGSYDDEFWVRWIMALPEKRVSLDMIYAEAHIRHAENLERRGIGDGIEEHIVEALRLDAGAVRGVQLMAQAQWAAGKEDRAIETMTRYLPYRPLDFEYRIQLAQMLSAAGRDDAAESMAVETELIAGVCVIKKRGAPAG